MAFDVPFGSAANVAFGGSTGLSPVGVGAGSFTYGQTAARARTAADTMTTAQQSRLLGEQVRSSQAQTDLANRQFNADQQLRQQLLGLLGIGDQPGLGQPGFREGGQFGSLYDQQRAAYESGGQEQLGLLEGFGESQRSRLAQQRSNQYGQLESNLALRGLAGSTLSQAGRTNINRQFDQAMLDLEDAITGRRLDVVGGKTEGIAGSFGDQAQTSAGLISSLLGAL